MNHTPEPITSKNFHRFLGKLADIEGHASPYEEAILNLFGFSGNYRGVMVTHHSAMFPRFTHQGIPRFCHDFSAAEDFVRSILEKPCTVSSSQLRFGLKPLDRYLTTLEVMPLDATPVRISTFKGWGKSRATSTMCALLQVLAEQPDLVPSFAFPDL